MSIYNVSGTSINAAYGVNGSPVSSAYNVSGSRVFGGGGGIVNYDSYTYQSYCGSKTNRMQGFDIHDGVIFQCTAEDTFATISVPNQALIQNDISIESDHGDSVSFSSEYYLPSDDYPLLYITSDSTPAKVYVNRVTTSSAQLVKTFSFPSDKTGYWAALAFDEINDVMYMVGYKEQSYTSDNGGTNKTVISKWDASNLTENQDGSFTPDFVEKYERDFIFVMQGQQFHDGMIWIASGYYTSENSYIYALNPADGSLLHTIDLDTTNEVEGLTFISDTEMVVGIAGGVGYRKYTFAPL